MHRSRYRPLLTGILVACLVTSLFVPTVVADTHNASDDESDRVYQLVHGHDESQVIPIEPIAGEEAVEERYDSETGSWGRSSTDNYHENDASTLLLYEGTEGVSFVGLHDKYHAREAAGTTGGSLSWTIHGLPEDGEWAVLDDESEDDIVYVAEDHRSGISDSDGEPPNESDALLSWVWSTSEAESVAYRGLDQDVSITIEPAVDEESYHRYGDQRRPNEPPDRPDRAAGYNGTVDDWEVIVPTDDGSEFERVDLHHTHEPTKIRSTSEPTRLGAITLENDSIDPGDSARLSAEIENPGDTDWTHEASLHIGDSEIQTKTVTVPAGEERTVEFSQQISQTGDYEIGVDDEQTKLTVRDPNSTDNEDTDDTTDEQTPGFGPVVAVVALCVAGIGSRYRSNS